MCHLSQLARKYHLIDDVEVCRLKAVGDDAKAKTEIGKLKAFGEKFLDDSISIATRVGAIDYHEYRHELSGQLKKATTAAEFIELGVKLRSVSLISATDREGFNNGLLPAKNNLGELLSSIPDKTIKEIVKLDNAAQMLVASQRYQNERYRQLSQDLIETAVGSGAVDLKTIAALKLIPNESDRVKAILGIKPELKSILELRSAISADLKSSDAPSLPAETIKAGFVLLHSPKSTLNELETFSRSLSEIRNLTAGSKLLIQEMERSPEGFGPEERKKFSEFKSPVEANEYLLKLSQNKRELNYAADQYNTLVKHLKKHGELAPEIASELDKISDPRERLAQATKRGLKFNFENEYKLNEIEETLKYAKKFAISDEQILAALGRGNTSQRFEGLEKLALPKRYEIESAEYAIERTKSVLGDLVSKDDFERIRKLPNAYLQVKQYEKLGLKVADVADALSYLKDDLTTARRYKLLTEEQIKVFEEMKDPRIAAAEIRKNPDISEALFASFTVKRSIETVKKHKLLEPDEIARLETEPNPLKVKGALSPLMEKIRKFEEVDSQVSRGMITLTLEGLLNQDLSQKLNEQSNDPFGRYEIMKPSLDLIRRVNERRMERKFMPE